MLLFSIMSSTQALLVGYTSLQRYRSVCGHERFVIHTTQGVFHFADVSWLDEIESQRKASFKFGHRLSTKSQNFLVIFAHGYAGRPAEAKKKKNCKMGIAGIEPATARSSVVRSPN